LPDINLLIWALFKREKTSKNVNTKQLHTQVDCVKVKGKEVSPFRATYIVQSDSQPLAHLFNRTPTRLL